MRVRRIIASLLVVVSVVAVVAYGTKAFFSDTETSVDNVLQAGAIDLMIDNHSYYNGVYRGDLSWELDNLDGHLFFNYDDLKPGDWGEDTVSIHVDSNDAWVCADLYVTRDDDMSSVEPELEEGDAAENPQDPMDGELARELSFVFWLDDGDNVWECWDEPGTAAEALSYANDSNLYQNCERWLTGGPAEDAKNGWHVALADSQGSVLGWDNEGQTWKPFAGGETYYIGKYWCYGDWEYSPVMVPGPDSTEPENMTGPDVRGAGFKCDGLPVDNMSQTDAVTADVSFYAVQTRHNEQFDCNDREPYTPEEMTRLRLENKTKDWQVIEDDRYGILDFANASPTFDFTLRVYDLEPGTEYSLHYYKDPWNSVGGMIIHTFTTDSNGDWNGSASVELNSDLPAPGDGNGAWAKLWVVPRSHLNADGSMNQWVQSAYLYEWNLVQYDDTDLL
ncbi:hypothetical protein JXA34_01685 [Patescibacteria group bacterium]|nr:hypothetical protein [Patescibacteria group bacterium]